MLCPNINEDETVEVHILCMVVEAMSKVVPMPTQSAQSTVYAIYGIGSGNFFCKRKEKD